MSTSMGWIPIVAGIILGVIAGKEGLKNKKILEITKKLFAESAVDIHHSVKDKDISKGVIGIICIVMTSVFIESKVAIKGFVLGAIFGMILGGILGLSIIGSGIVGAIATLLSASLAAIVTTMTVVHIKFVFGVIGGIIGMVLSFNIMSGARLEPTAQIIVVGIGLISGAIIGVILGKKIKETEIYKKMYKDKTEKEYEYEYENEMSCAHCGTKILVKTNFCTKCGTKL